MKHTAPGPQPTKKKRKKRERETTREKEERKMQVFDGLLCLVYDLNERYFFALLKRK